MPFMYGSGASHDDNQHQGSAKRDTASGVAGLTALGTVLATGNGVSLTRDASNDVRIIERTSVENVLTARRTAANTYTLYNNTVAGGKILQDSSMKDVASGIAGLDASVKVPNTSLYLDVASGIMGLDAQKLMSGGNMAAFNLLKIYDNNIITDTLVGTGDIIESVANGTVQISCPANADDADFLEIVRVALSGLPRIAVFRINSIALLGAATTCGFGLESASFGTGEMAAVITEDGGTNWQFRTFLAAATNTAIVAPAAGDVFVFYLAAGRCVLLKNGISVAAHVTNIPTAAIGHNAWIQTAAAQGAGSQLTLGFMS